MRALLEVKFVQVNRGGFPNAEINTCCWMLIMLEVFTTQKLVFCNTSINATERKAEKLKFFF